MSSLLCRQKAILLVYFFFVAAGSSSAANDSIWHRSSLLDGPDSSKEWLRARGITADASLTHFLEGFVVGDGDQELQSGGKGDLVLKLDGHKLGLWKGLFLNIHGEVVYGENTNSQGNGNIIPTNTALAFPTLGGSNEELSVVLTQAFDERTLLSLGKFNMLDAASRTPLLGGGGIDTFMHLGLAAPISGVTPAYIIGGLLTHRADFASIGLFVYDPRSAQDSDVLENPFADGVTLSLSVAVPTQLFGDTSIHRVRGVYSSQDGMDLRDIPLLALPPEAEAQLRSKSGYWFFSYAFQHFLFQNEQDPSRGWGLFGQIALSDGNPNPFEWSGFVGVGGNSPFAGRPNDRFGIAYLVYSLSSDLVNALSPVISLDDEQAVEAYYSYALTPWFLVSGNIQLIDPALSNKSRTVFLGLRTQVKF